MLDTDDLALWYALNRLMTNYWDDVDHNGGKAGRTSFICRRRSTPSAPIGSKERKRFAPSTLGGGSTAISPRVTWSATFGYSGMTLGAPGQSG
jgi:hypothetical protein